MKIFLTPAMLYSFLWLFLIFIYNFRLSYLLLPINTNAGIFLLGSILAFLLGYILNIMHFNKKSSEFDIDNYTYFVFNNNTSKLLSKLLIILITGLSIEVIYFGNIPIFSVFGIGREIRYTEFGFPGIHGFFNAIYLVISSILFARQLVKPNKKNLIYLSILLIFPFALMTRQLFISMVVQFIFLYILIKPINLFSLAKLTTIVLIVLFVFGYIGDMRTGRESFIALAQPTFDYPDELPTGLLWAYIYLTSPINNVINNIDIQPNYAPISIISGLFPSFVRDLILNLFDNNIYTSWVLVNETLNVSSIHQKVLTDFGIWLGLMFYTGLSFYLQIFHRKAKKNPRYGFALSVVLHSIFLSFFVDFIFNLVFIAQIIIYVRVFRNV